jgi:hypothetical protein
MTRVWLVLICLALVVLALVGMWIGWRNRERRQGDLPELPSPPADLGARRLDALDGEYVGTAYASSWQDRVVHGGLGMRSGASLALHETGVLLERDGSAPLFLPAAAITGARLAPGLANKVVGTGGLLVISWRLGDAQLDTGFRADDKSSYPRWVRAIEMTVGART